MGCIYSKCCCFKASASASPTSKELQPKPRGPKFAPNSTTTSISSDEANDEDDQLNQLGTRDSDVGITRLSRVSSQFLPPEGSRKVRVPIGNYDLKYSYLSQRGYYPEALDKPNQDSFTIHTPFGTNPDDHFFGVFDGHGEYGAQCSQFVKCKLCENLLRNPLFHTDPLEALHSSFLLTNSQLHDDPNIDDSMSGTTAITVLVRGRTMYIANSGDSRAIIAEKRDEHNEDLIAVDLSIDQTPFRKDETERVKACGARVLTLDQIEGFKNPDVQCWGDEDEEGDDGDPPRLWVPNGMYPGTAFTRSIGDSVAESIGVCADPETFVLELNPSHPFFVLASDGVFEFLSSQTVVDMVAKFKDPRDACAAIVAESYRLWLQYETRTDDITIILVHINGLNSNGLIQTIAKGPAKGPTKQTVEITGLESPLINNNNRARQDLSKARLRALENSLENGRVWVPPSPSHRKTWEEEAHIERVLHDHFLFRRLTDSQCNVLLDCMRRIDVQPGEIIVQQGGEGDCFYVVGSGEFEVFAIQDENGTEITKILHQYTADKLSSFGELALMYNKPLQASVRAVTGGTLWALRREDFRGILMSEFTNLPSLKLLRSIPLFSRLTILQLSQIDESLLEFSFSDGQQIITKNDCISSLYIIKKGEVKIRYNPDFLSQNSRELLCGYHEKQEEEGSRQNGEIVISISEGGHFGEWALLGERIESLLVVSTGDVQCAVISKEKFEEIVGPVLRFPHDDDDNKNEASLVENKDSLGEKFRLSDLEWKMCLYSTDCGEIGLVNIKNSDKIASLKRYSRRKIKELGKESQVIRERDIMKGISAIIPCVPQIFCTGFDTSYLGILLNSRLVCSLSSIILKSPLDENSARFYVASLVVALDELHKRSILQRGISPEIIMIDRTGRLQLVDFRFAKKLENERTYTICGTADSLAPEIVLGKGHGFSADWWALGVLIYFMLQGEMPFGTLRQSELDTVAKIAKGQFTLPENFSIEAVDLITKLLEVEERERLGSDGVDKIKRHDWFNGLNWDEIQNGTYRVPVEIVSRIENYTQIHVDEGGIEVDSTNQDSDEIDLPDWIEDW